MRIGIYGGTFNPPHIGHLRSAKTAANQLGLDLLIIVPSGIPPHKPLPDDTPSADARLHMTQVSFAGLKNAVVTDIEAKSPHVSYSIDTVASIMREYPGAELFLLMGTDMYLTIYQWKEAPALLDMITPVVFSRGSGDRKRVADYSDVIEKRFGVRTETVINDVVDISSSQIRDMFPKRKGVEYVNDEVYSYIISKRFYGAKPDWEWLRTRAYSMLSPKRIPHVVGCEEEAVRLSKRWGADSDEAREAAILHDITKILKPEENIAIIQKHGGFVGDLNRGEEKLLHSKTAAIIANTEFGVSYAVSEAIIWHTTGKARMTDLEKIIYLADYIEPTRDFEGVDALRTLSYENLDEAMRMGIEITIADLKERGIVPNRKTIDALDDLLSI